MGKSELQWSYHFAHSWKKTVDCDWAWWNQGVSGNVWRCETSTEIYSHNIWWKKSLNTHLVKFSRTTAAQYPFYNPTVRQSGSKTGFTQPRTDTKGVFSCRPTDCWSAALGRGFHNLSYRWYKESEEWQSRKCKCLITTVSSTGRCNTCMKFLCWCFVF